MRFLLIPLLLASLTATESPAAILPGNDQNEPEVAVMDRAEPETASAGADPRRALDAWLESFNEHDAATRERWLLDNTTLPPEQAKKIAGIDQQIRSAMGSFELVRVVRTEGRVIEAEARHTGDGTVARIEMTLDEQQPKRIADVKLQKAENQEAGHGGMPDPAGAQQGPAPAPQSSAPGVQGSWEGFMEDVGGDQFITINLLPQSDGSEGTFLVLGRAIPVNDVQWNGDRVTARVASPADGLNIDARIEDGSLVGRLTEGAHVQRFSLQRIPEYPTPPDRIGRWTQDLEVLTSRFLKLDLSFTPGERAMFLEAVENIRAELPTLNDAQVTMRMASAIALANNPHTRLLLLRNATELRRLPIRLWWFNDGLHVIRATPEYRHLLGCRIDDVAGVDIRQARDIVGRAFAGTPSWRDYMSVYSLTSPEALHGLGITPDLDQVEFGVSRCGGNARHAVRPLPLARSQRTVETWWDLSPLRENPHGASAHILPAQASGLPLYLRNPEAYYWFEHLPDSGILYFQYNRADQSPNESMDAFGQRLLAQIQRQKPRAVVLDLRFNTGGNAGLARDLMRRLQEGTRGIPHYIITSRSTFSAGISHVATFKSTAPVTIVGEPAGDELDHWSEGGYIKLPNSGYEVDFQTGFHSYSPGACPADVRCSDLSVASIQPDILVRQTWTDYIGRRDPSMEAVIRHLSM